MNSIALMTVRAFGSCCYHPIYYGADLHRRGVTVLHSAKKFFCKTNSFCNRSGMFHSRTLGNTAPESSLQKAYVAAMSTMVDTFNSGTVPTVNRTRRLDYPTPNADPITGRLGDKPQLTGSHLMKLVEMHMYKQPHSRNPITGGMAENIPEISRLVFFDLLRIVSSERWLYECKYTQI